jgi:hypothetical protein
MPSMKQYTTGTTFQRLTTDTTIGYKPILFSSATNIAYYVLDATDASNAATKYTAGETFSVPTTQIFEWYIDPSRLWVATAGGSGTASILIKDQ